MLFLVHFLLKNFHHIVIVTFTLLEEWCLQRIFVLEERWIYSFEETFAEFQEVFPWSCSTKNFWTAQEELLTILDKMET
jgi:hypothetical protein